MSEWGIDRLDLDAYLARIGHDGDTSATPETLRAIQRAHVGAIPFENLDIALGRGVDVDLDAVQAKLVGRRRGGYCYEHNLLFAAALERLGFTVERLLARVGDGERVRPRTHLTLRVDGAWLADAGFGAGELVPVAFGTPGRQDAGDWAYELVEIDTGWELLELGPEGWDVGYRFDAVPQHHADVVMANHFSATHPSSPFTTRIVASRMDEHFSYRLVGRTLETMRPEAPREFTELGDDEYAAVLRDDFGLGLTDAEVARLTELTS